MRRWIAPILVSCATAVAAARALTPGLVPGRTGTLIVSGLLVCAVATVWGALLYGDARRGAGAARKRAGAEPRYRALFEACGDVICVYELPGDGRPGLLVEANETACMAPATRALLAARHELRRALRARGTARGAGAHARPARCR